MANPSIWAPGVAVSAASSIRSQAFTATPSQTLFTLTSFSYELGTGSLYVYVSGLMQRPGIDFTETSATEFTLTTPVQEDTVVLAVATVEITGDVQTDSGYLYFLYDATGAVTRTVESKLSEYPSVLDFDAVGDGVVDDTGAFTAATALGINIYVPETADFYAVTSLTDAQRKLLYGPGIVKVAGVVTTINTVAAGFSNSLPRVSVFDNDQQPVEYYSGLRGSVGTGAFTAWNNRTGGWGSYGNILNNSYVSAALGGSGFEFDSGITSWVNAANMAGSSAVFGFWGGANTPAYNKGHTYTAGSACGMEINAGNRWSNFGLQTDVSGTRYTVALQLVPDVLPSRDGPNSVAVSVASGSPAVMTLVAHGFMANMGVVFGGSGTLPTGLSKATTYYVVNSSITADTFSVSATPGGTAINTTGSASGSLTILPSWPGSFASVTAHSIWGHQWWVGHFIRADTIAKNGYAYLTAGGSSAETVGGAYSVVTGYWGLGIDMLNATLTSNTAIRLPASASISWNGTSMNGTSTTFGLSTGAGTGAGGIYASNFSYLAIQWKSSGSAAQLGFFGTAAQSKPTVTGSKAANAALTSLMTALSNLGLVTDSTT